MCANFESFVLIKFQPLLYAHRIIDNRQRNFRKSNLYYDSVLLRLFSVFFFLWRIPLSPSRYNDINYNRNCVLGINVSTYPNTRNYRVLTPHIDPHIVFRLNLKEAYTTRIITIIRNRTITKSILYAFIYVYWNKCLKNVEHYVLFDYYFPPFFENNSVNYSQFRV